jgi:hypothetical protein
MARSRTSLRWTTVWLFSLLVVPSLAQSNFDFYPEAARPCLERSAADTDCENTNVERMNRCFCNNGNDFITNVARCVGREAEDEVQAVFDTMQDACLNSNTPMSVRESAFLDAASGEDTTSTTTTTTTATTETTSTQTSDPTSTGEPTSTQTNDPGNDDDNGGGDSEGLSQGAIIGIGVGAGVGGAALIGALAWFLIRRRRQSKSIEASPMLPYQGHGSYQAPTTFPASEPSPGFGAFTDGKVSPSNPSVSPNSTAMQQASWYTTPPLFQGQQSPQAFPQQPYQMYNPQNAYAPHSSPPPPTHSNGPVEIDGVQQNNVAEMPGSSPQSGWRPAL